MESRTQASRPRTQKKFEAKAKGTAFPRTDTLEAKNRNARGQGQGPRTQAQVLSKKKKGLHKNFSGDLQKKKVFKKFFKRSPQNFNNSKNSAVLEDSTSGTLTCYTKPFKKKKYALCYLRFDFMRELFALTIEQMNSRKCNRTDKFEVFALISHLTSAIQEPIFG